MTDALAPNGGRIIAAFLRPLGDAVRAVPELRYLARMTGAKIDLIVKKKWQKQLYTGLDYIGDVLPLNNWRLPFFLSSSQLDAIRHLKNIHPSLGFILSRKAKLHKLFRLLAHIGVPAENIVEGVPGWSCRYPAFPHFLPDARDLAPPALAVRDSELAAMRDRLAHTFGWSGEPLFLLHPGCGALNRSASALNKKGGKNWAWENWVVLATAMRQAAPNALIALTGSEAEQELTAHIGEKSGGVEARVVSMAGATSIRELLALQALAASAISINTGASHTAMAVGCPLVSIFGNHNPFTFTASSFGWGACHTVRGADIKGKWVASEASPINLIRPETVLKAWRELPARLPEPCSRPYVAHYLEGGGEGVRQHVFDEERVWGILPRDQSVR